MLLKETHREIAISQKRELAYPEPFIKRNILKKADLDIPHTLIISGIRRCGKSTFLLQLMRKIRNAYYFNFEDPRTVNFELPDFEKLDSVFHEEFGESDHYFFDEIQNVQGWERFVRKMQDAGKKFIITGSNSSLMSMELGTKLTGRHVNFELFPFSFMEMLEFTSQERTLAAFNEYFLNGGFPEFLKYKKQEILHQLFTDILVRDIVARYNLRDSKVLKELAVYLYTNAAKEFSYNKLKQYFNLGSTNTVISYISYLEDSYLLFTIPKFDYSFKKQIVNPKKVYTIDTGLTRAISASFSADKGRVLENLIFLNLRKVYNDIFYFKEEKECDFLIRDRGKIINAIQVCYRMDTDNKEREISGLQAAMKKFNLKRGTIVTFDQEDKFGNIRVLPAWKYIN